MTQLGPPNNEKFLQLAEQHVRGKGLVLLYAASLDGCRSAWEDVGALDVAVLEVAVPCAQGG